MNAHRLPCLRDVEQPCHAVSRRHRCRLHLAIVVHLHSRRPSLLPCHGRNHSHAEIVVVVTRLSRFHPVVIPVCRCRHCKCSMPVSRHDICAHDVRMSVVYERRVLHRQSYHTRRRHLLEYKVADDVRDMVVAYRPANLHCLPSPSECTVIVYHHLVVERREEVLVPFAVFRFYRVVVHDGVYLSFRRSGEFSVSYEAYRLSFRHSPFQCHLRRHVVADVVIRFVLQVHVIFKVLEVALQFHPPSPVSPLKLHERRDIERVDVRQILPLPCVVENEVCVLHLLVFPCRASVHSRRQFRHVVRLLSAHHVFLEFQFPRHGVRPVSVVVQLAFVVLGIRVCRRVCVLQFRCYLVSRLEAVLISRQRLERRLAFGLSVSPFSRAEVVFVRR